MTQDLEFDGDPESDFFTSPVSGFKLWHGWWSPSRNIHVSRSSETTASDDASAEVNEGSTTPTTKGAWILIHGLRGYSRYSWLLKAPKVTEGKEIMRMNEILPDLDIEFPKEATDEHRNTMPFYKGSWIQALNHLGHTVHAMDLQGHGLSEGERCGIENGDVFVADVAHYIWNVVAPRYPADTPIYAIGVSLGGNVLLRCLQTHQPRKLQAAIILGGMCTTPADGKAIFPKIGAAFNRYFLAKLFPKLPVAPMGDAVTEANVGFLHTCPHVWTKPLTAQTVESLIRIARELREGQISGAWCTENLFILHNSQDPTCPIDGCVPFWNRLVEANVIRNLSIAVLNDGDLCPKVRSRITEATKAKFLNDLKQNLDLRHTLMCDVDHAYIFSLIHQFTTQGISTDNA
eukprot:Gregarina_sp_Pseudo_9__1001@NODE_1644_length_1429_cov_42_164029_g1524_i0_p1_GENE_NODE_1644_length_1429_cov_42_164029_g1524_i0NODE_1644_length_1429_cov_42_164029_g1524_i0_p1_ORF_typecomplete_len403_score23_95Hydrolase_4/PF12146_8/1_3e25Abhydrolase_1/PF00561_20/3_3e10Abhydrolase_6/PF12697_7/1_8e09Peptidase_S9/PF00326_21/0_0051Peptidase_S9/PF00326_21/2_3DUF1100/PF06500_11/7_4e06Ser_hydrolase/PF06821_13/9e03Ser_hydrolase/PF06821_13/0_0054Ser_hydrolase/PF06821_13/3_9e03DLH/PF01738_18/0_03DLH/PF01738_